MAFSAIYWIVILISSTAAMYRVNWDEPIYLPHDQLQELIRRPPVVWRWKSTSDRELDIPRPEGELFASDWLPIYETRTPYDEDEIVSLLNEYGQMYDKLINMPPDSVVWPPDGRHRINKELCREVGMSPKVISLLPRLIYSVSYGGGIHYDTWMNTLNYGKDSDIIGSREATIICDLPEGQTKLLPQEVILAWGDREVNVMVLDTEENTIRLANQQRSIEEMNPPWYTSLEYPDQDHYRNYYPRHAPTYLRMLVQRLKFLDIIPATSSGWGGILVSNNYDPWVWRRMRHILIGTYGWPDMFQQEKYQAESPASYF